MENTELRKKFKKFHNNIKSVRSIVEVNVLAEAIKAKVRFLGRMEYSTEIFALLQKKNIEILTNFSNYILQEFW